MIRRLVALVGAGLLLVGCEPARFSQLCDAHVPEGPIEPVEVDGVEFQGLDPISGGIWREYADYVEFTVPDPGGYQHERLVRPDLLMDGMYRSIRVPPESQVCLSRLRVRFGDQAEAFWEDAIAAGRQCYGFVPVDQFSSRYRLVHTVELSFARVLFVPVSRTQTVLFDKEENKEVSKLVVLQMWNFLPPFPYVPLVHRCGNAGTPNGTRRIRRLVT